MTIVGQATVAWSQCANHHLLPAKRARQRQLSSSAVGHVRPAHGDDEGLKLAVAFLLEVLEPVAGRPPLGVKRGQIERPSAYFLERLSAKRNASVHGNAAAAHKIAK